MSEICKEAAARYPHWARPEPGDPDPDYSEMDARWQDAEADESRRAFEEGALWALGRAARVAEAGHDPLAHCCDDCSVYSERWKIAAAIREIGESND